MKNYIVEVTFQGSYQIEVKAKSAEEACEKVENSKKFANLKWEDASCREIEVSYADEE